MPAIVRKRIVVPESFPLRPILVPVDEFASVKRFDAAISLEADDAKKFTIVKDGDVITDYRDVRIKGYLSTFRATTESDRQGDYVIEGAFKDTIPDFMSKNPVLLRDHHNICAALSGSFTVMKEDRKGLYVEGNLSNAPDVQSTRWKVAEGHLRTMSMGGAFYYLEDGRGIFKVSLWEGSLTPIPANQDALITTRSLNETEKKFLKLGGSKSFTAFVQAEAQSRTLVEVAA